MKINSFVNLLQYTIHETNNICLLLISPLRLYEIMNEF